MMYDINLTGHGIILGMQETKVNFQTYEKCMQVKTCTKLTLEKISYSADLGIWNKTLVNH